MSPILWAGVVASFVGFLWSMYEQENPEYWVTWGLSKTAANLINISTGLLFPGGYLLILFAPGYSWWFTIGAVLVTHFIVVMILGGGLYGAVSGRALRRKHQRELEQLKKTRPGSADG
jgi:hypothetical protein